MYPSADKYSWNERRRTGKVGKTGMRMGLKGKGREEEKRKGVRGRDGEEEDRRGDREGKREE